MASNFYRAVDSPRYVLGHSLEMGFVCVGIIAAVVLNVGYAIANKRRASRLAQDSARGVVDMGTQELSEQGDKALTFRYMH